VTLALPSVVLATRLAWGGGTLCGWLGPYGALPEFAAEVRSPLSWRFALLPSCKIANSTMGHNIHTLKQARAFAPRVWRDAATFFLSIELHSWCW
jgi:hypothetical protein